jgi:predicted RNA-binding protein YlqC (UPF0109 family)
MKDFVQSIVRELVDEPDGLRMTTLDGEKTKIIEMRCAQKDIGKIIGKSGKTITALRVLASSVAARQNSRAVVEVVE